MDDVVTLLGPPGSGKGTQAERLRDRGFSWLSTGDLLREARGSGSELGDRAAAYMDRGELVPDEVIDAVVRDAIAEREGEPILLDGFPRSLSQAADLDAALRGDGRMLTHAVLIDVPDEVVAERISHRGQGRADDNPETVKARLAVYHRETEPLITHYEDRGLLRRIDGCGAPDDVAARVREALGG
jgi:adenylate kinase